MPSGQTRDNPFDGEDKIPIEGPDSSDTNMEGEYLDQPGRQRSAYDDSHEPARQPVHDKRKYADRPCDTEPIDRHASHYSPYDTFIPGLSTLDSQPASAFSTYEAGSPHDASFGANTDSYSPLPRARRRSPSRRLSNFSASQETTLHYRPQNRSDNRPSSPIKDGPERRARSRSGERSKVRSQCQDPLATLSEREQHGRRFRLWPWLHNPTGEMTIRKKVVVTTRSDDEKERPESRKRKR